jgi:hypothetical protein
MSQSTQAYKLFSEGKSPVQVAIALNLRQPQVTEFYTEHWKLKGLYMLNQIYEEIKGDIGSFVNLFRLAKTAGMNVQQVNRLLTIANNHLPSVEYIHERLKREIGEIEADKHNSARILQELSDQIATMRKTLDQYQLSCKEQRLELTNLQLQKIRLEGIVDSFQNDNEEYDKIRNTIEEKVVSILSDKKMLLKLALLSLTESMRKDPDRYSSLIYHNNTSSNIEYNSQNYETASYGQQQQYQSQDYISMLIEEAEKLYTTVIKEWVDKIITDYTFSMSSSSLPLLSPSDEKAQQ